MNRTPFAFVWLGFFSFAALAQARDEDNPHWLSDAEVAALVAAEPPVPAPGSAADKTDLQLEVAAQKNRTKAAVTEAWLDKTWGLNLFLDPIDPEITQKKDPQFFAFFDHLRAQAGVVVTQAKNHWGRPRPYAGHPEAITNLFPVDGFSYPSGHSALSFVFAQVLGQIFPEHAHSYLARAEAIAQSRVDAGVHYKSDIDEGERLAGQIVDELKAKPDFQRSLQGVRDEVADQR